MNITKFLLTDLALTIPAFLLLFLLKSGKTNHLNSSIKEKALKKNFSKLPNKEKLLELEKLSKVKGSGIEYNLLMGDWKFISVWKNDKDNEDSLFSSLLRIFSAKLKLSKSKSTKNTNNLFIITSIKFGLFSIEFSGCGYLKGKQPLLTFFFNIIKLKSGSKVLLRRALKEPTEKKKPFFSLIASKESSGWLSARGQGGALVLWIKE